MTDTRGLEPYALHVFDVSYFSGKMQAYLAWKEVPHRVHHVSWQELSRRIAPRTGLVEVPVVECANGDFLRDSTAMIEWFEERYPRGRVLPDDPAAAFFCRLLEDYADEGLWRPALYYRWAFAKDSILNARRFTEEFLWFPGTPAALLRGFVRNRQARTYMREEGVTPGNRRDVEKHYLDELDDLQALFGERPFLFGQRPSLADFGLFASMFRHFSIDPTPARIMRDRAPAVYEWVARMWNARASRLGDGAWAQVEGGLPSGLAPMLERAGRRYLPTLHANAVAVAEGRTHYDVVLEGSTYPGLAAVPFQAWRRTVLQRMLASLDGDVATTVRTTLSRHGCLEWLEKDGVLDHRYPEGEHLPRCRPRSLSIADRARIWVAGTPHHREAGSTTGPDRIART